MHEDWKKYADKPTGPPRPPCPVDPEREAEIDRIMAEYFKKPDDGERK